MKVLNLYAGIGGNRKLWTDVEVTAVEWDEKIAQIYQDFFPNDKMVVGDAHQYLLEHYMEFDFIWSSPPCPTHSGTNNFLNAQGIIRYPDMSLWQEIILLQHFHKGKYCIENVKSYYDPFIKPQISGRHYFWANFNIPNFKIESSIGSFKSNKHGYRSEGKNHFKLGFDLSKYNYNDKNKLLNNCVVPEIGLSILECARGIIKSQDVTQKTIFDL